jgi:hypothetical protein
MMLPLPDLRPVKFSASLLADFEARSQLQCRAGMANVKDRARPRPDHQKELVKAVEALGYRHGHWQVFADFIEMAAVSVSNAVDWAGREKREERYLQVVKRYKPDELARFPDMLGSLTMALEDETTDVLGCTFHDLELHNKWSGQYFSPFRLCRMMAKMTIADSGDLESRISERGFVTAQEPAVGSGAMIIALAHEMREAGINYQRHLHVTAVDVDPKCVHMSYLQFSLLHIPAVIVHGNSLSLESFDHWYTPAHILGGWNWKLKRRSGGDHPLQTVSAPEPGPKRPGDDEPPAQPTQLALF